MSDTLQHDELVLAHLDARIALLHQQQAALRDQHVSLCLTREKLFAKVVAKRVSNAPMRTLIPELCAHIFFFCVSAEEHLDRQNIWHICAPVILSNVCRRWRTMVVHNPFLWTQLCVRLDDDINHLVRVKLWISRSASLPFHLTLRPSTLPPPTGIPESLLQPFMQAIRFLSAHIHRLKSLTIEPGIPIIPLLLSGGSLPPMPHLTHLILDTDDKDDASIVRSPLDAPLLHYLRLRDLTSMQRILQPSLGHIRTLVITATNKQWLNLTLFPEFLSQCVQLIDCTIMFPPSYTALPTETVLLPRLQILHLHWCGTSDPAEFVGSLQTPSLEHLTLQHDTLESFKNTRLNRFSLEDLVASAPSLRCVTLMNCSFSTEYDISSVLANAANLSRLEILKCRHSSLLLSSLTSRSQGQPATWPCPRLSHLFISSFAGGDVRSVLEFVRKRIDGRGQPKVHEGCGYHYLEMLEIGNSLGILGYSSRVLMRKGLQELEDSGRIAIVKCQV